MTEPEVIKKALKKLEACKELCHDSLGIHEFKVVKTALNKQIPMKPKTLRTVDGETIYYVCPNCKQDLWGIYLFCYECGQKIDWSNSDD